jgi:hypothetical protein
MRFGLLLVGYAGAKDSLVVLMHPESLRLVPLLVEEWICYSKEEVMDLQIVLELVLICCSKEEAMGPQTELVRHPLIV